MIELLIVGGGGIARRHIHAALATEGVRLALVEPDDARRRQAQERHGIREGWASLRDAPLERFDAAIICAPANVHVPLARQCAEAGLPFLVEKPLSVDLDGVDALVEAVTAGGLLARVGYVRRAAPEMAYVRAALERGDIGALRMMYINVSQNFPSFRPDYRETYFARPEMGGGAILDACSHHIDTAIFCFGRLTEVTCMHDHLQLPDVEVEDAALILLRSEGGGLVQISVNQFQRPNVSTTELIGSEGNLLYDSVNRRLQINRGDGWDEIPIERPSFGLQPGDVYFKHQLDLFLGALAGRPDHLATLPEARDNLRLALAAREADISKRTICL